MNSDSGWSKAITPEDLEKEANRHQLAENLRKAIQDIIARVLLRNAVIDDDALANPLCQTLERIMRFEFNGKELELITELESVRKYLALSSSSNETSLRNWIVSALNAKHLVPILLSVHCIRNYTPQSVLLHADTKIFIQSLLKGLEWVDFTLSNSSISPPTATTVLSSGETSGKVEVKKKKVKTKVVSLE